MKKVILQKQKKELIAITKEYKAKMTILEEARNAVYGDRQADYGTVTENFGTIAKFWSAVLKTNVTPEQVGLCMIQVKIARQMYKPKRDNLIDGAGYFATIEKMENETKQRKWKNKNSWYTDSTRGFRLCST